MIADWDGENAWGSKPIEPSEGAAASGDDCEEVVEGSRRRCVTVLDDECEDGGAPLGDIASRCWCDGGGDGEAASSSGLAMRNPPSDWDRLRSPFIAYCEAMCQAISGPDWPRYERFVLGLELERGTVAGRESKLRQSASGVRCASAHALRRGIETQRGMIMAPTGGLDLLRVCDVELLEKTLALR